MTLLCARLAHIFQCRYGYEGWPISPVKLRLVCQSVWNSVQQELTMPQFDPGLIQLMRTVLEDAMTRVAAGNLRHDHQGLFGRGYP